MNTLSLLLLGALPQLPTAPPQADGRAAAVAFAGTLGEGLAEIERLSRAGEVEEAIAVSEALLAPNEFTRWRRELEAEDSKVVAPALGLVDPLLERLGLNGYAEPLRAEVMYARGCARLAAEEREAAEKEFADARAASGAGELRLVASYNRGTAALLEAEVWRAQIPEVSGQPAAPPPGAAGVPPMPGLPGAGPPAPGADEPPDPLEVARGHYQRAKGALVERLRQDWRDADTRANVELVQRRLKELDEIERQREEQEQEQDQQQQDEQQDQEQQDQDDSQQQDSQDESQQDESDQQEEQEQEQPPESEGEEPEPEEQESDEEQESEEESEESQEPQEAEPQEIYLTREEVQRLLDRLREHEEEAEALRARLYQQSRRRVERDW